MKEITETNNKKITKAVFPVAGFGTRFLPATKASPKEMLPIVDKPLIQYAVEEVIAAGVTDLIFITGRNKRSIEDHFDKAYELETELELKNKLELLNLTQIVPENVNCIFIRQNVAQGLGHAVLCSKTVIGNDPFIVILADELIDAKPNAISQMLEVYEKTNNSVIGINEVDPTHVSSYGIVKLDMNNKIEEIIEKPQLGAAPSNLAVVGRYILTPAIFNELEQSNVGINHEIQLTDAIARVLKYETVYAYQIQGTRYDCGSKLGYLKATINYALNHPELALEFKQYLLSLNVYD